MRPRARSSARRRQAPAPNVGIAYDVGGRGDLSFNDSAYAGVTKAADELDATFKEAEAGAGENDADREERLRLLADAGFNPILAVGFVYSPAVGKVAAEYPDIDFAVVDGYVSFLGDDKVANATDLNFAANEGSFLDRCRGRSEDEDRDGRLPRRRQRSAHPGLRGRLQGRRRGRRPEGQDPHRVPLAGRPGQGLREPRRRQDRRRGHVRRRRRHRLPRSRQVRTGPVRCRCRSGQGQVGYRCRLRPVPHGGCRPEAAHPDVHAQARRRRRLRLPQVVRGRQGRMRSRQLRPEESMASRYSTSGGFVNDIKKDLNKYRDQIIAGKIKVPATP